MPDHAFFKQTDFQRLFRHHLLQRGGLLAQALYRLLKAHDLMTSPAFIVMKAANEFKDKTTAPNQMWQTDFIYFKITGWGCNYLSNIPDDFSRYVIAWKLCTTMKEDVTDTTRGRTVFLESLVGFPVLFLLRNGAAQARLPCVRPGFTSRSQCPIDACAFAPCHRVLRITGLHRFIRHFLRAFRFGLPLLCFAVCLHGCAPF
jgi:hypothetical protein